MGVVRKIPAMEFVGEDGRVLYIGLRALMEAVKHERHPIRFVIMELLRREVAHD